LEAYNVEVGVVSTADARFRVLSLAEVEPLLAKVAPAEGEAV
jgi:hypothetical protein